MQFYFLNKFNIKEKYGIDASHLNYLEKQLFIYFFRYQGREMLYARCVGLAKDVAYQLTPPQSMRIPNFI